jgi:predicted transcriptional regulator
MGDDNQGTTQFSRNKLAYLVLGLSILAIVVLGIIAISKSNNENDAMMVFNATLPVFASWIGTVLAFYFGKENFESANAQVGSMVQKLSMKQKTQAYVDSIMITPYAMTSFKMTTDDKKEIMLSELIETLTRYHVSRLPMINNKGEICFVIHESKITKFLAQSDKEASQVTLEDFLDAYKAENHLFTLNASFVIVSKDTLILQAKNRLEACQKCKDIIVTQNGTIDEPMIGWIPDMHLLGFLEA